MQQRLFKFLLITALGLAVIHCGKQNQRVTAMGQGTNFTGNNSPGTGGRDQVTNPYSSVNPAEEVSRLKDAVGMTAPNQVFASAIQSATVTASPTTPDDQSPLEVQVKLNDLAQPLVFRGDLQADKDGFISDLIETTGKRPDLKISAQCTDKPCHHGDLVLSDANGHKAGIIVNKENRVLHMKLPDDENAEQLKNTSFADYKEDRTVEVTSTEIYPGKPSYSVREIGKDPKKPALSIDGALFDPEGDAIPTQGNDVAQKLGSISLVGKSQDELVFKVTETPTATKTAQPVDVYFEASRPTATVSNTIKQNCPVHLPGQIHPLINSVLKDCTHPRIVEKIASRTKEKASRAQLVKFITLYHDSFKATQPSQALDFHKMLGVLHENNFPDIWTLVTLRESHFDWRWPGTSGEQGVWQIMPKTADGLHLPRNQRKLIIPETTAAMNYYKMLMADWDKDVEMSLAAYNSGRDKKSIEKKHIYSKNFWVLCQLNALPSSTCDYVKDILSTMTVSLDPAAYGVTEVAPMEAR